MFATTTCESIGSTTTCYSEIPAQVDTSGIVLGISLLLLLVSFMLFAMLFKAFKINNSPK